MIGKNRSRMLNAVTLASFFTHSVYGCDREKPDDIREKFHQTSGRRASLSDTSFFSKGHNGLTMGMHDKTVNGKLYPRSLSVADDDEREDSPSSPPIENIGSPNFSRKKGSSFNIFLSQEVEEGAGKGRKTPSIIDMRTQSYKNVKKLITDAESRGNKVNIKLINVEDEKVVNKIKNKKWKTGHFVETNDDIFDDFIIIDPEIASSAKNVKASANKFVFQLDEQDSSESDSRESDNESNDELDKGPPDFSSFSRRPSVILHQKVPFTPLPARRASGTIPVSKTEPEKNIVEETVIDALNILPSPLYEEPPLGNGIESILPAAFEESAPESNNNEEEILAVMLAGATNIEQSAALFNEHVNPPASVEEPENGLMFVEATIPEGPEMSGEDDENGLLPVYLSKKTPLSNAGPVLPERGTERSTGHKNNATVQKLLNSVAALPVKNQTPVGQSLQNETSRNLVSIYCR